MSAREAGRVAHEAAVKHLVITHYRSGDQFDAHHLAEARKAFDGPLDLAREGKTYVVE
jgi:ribonuclease BN (tRNA processing enzyme)